MKSYKRVLIVVHDMIADRQCNETLTPIAIVTSRSYFKVPKTIRLNVKHYFVMKISNRRGLH